MGRYLTTYAAVVRAKQAGAGRPPRIERTMRQNIVMAMMGTRIATVFETPLESRLWQIFRLSCERLDRGYGGENETS